MLQPINHVINYYNGNRFVEIWISDYFKTFDMSVVNLQGICFQVLGHANLGTFSTD